MSVQGSTLKALWRAPGERHPAAAAAAEDTAYEEVRIGAAGGVRARAGDRELTMEEVKVREEREREAAEAAAAADGEGASAGLPAGGYAARRARVELEVRGPAPTACVAPAVAARCGVVEYVGAS